MKNYFTILSLLFGIFASIALVSCSKNDNDEPKLDSYFYLSIYDYNNKNDWERENTAYIGWDDFWDMDNNYLRLEFDEGIPVGADWYLECDMPWIELKEFRGRIKGMENQSHHEVVRYSIQHNNSYDDREAHIYLNVPEGDPVSSYNATVTIHQYGYESHLRGGKYVSFRTNRSKAETSILTIDHINLSQIVEIDWGDGSKDLITRYDKMKESGYYISHNYSSNDSFEVRIRFAPDEDDRIRFKCYIDDKQGVESVEYDSHEVFFFNSALHVSISYSDENGFDVHQF